MGSWQRGGGGLRGKMGVQIRASPFLPEAYPTRGGVALPESVIKFLSAVSDPVGQMSQEGRHDRQQTSMPSCQPCLGFEWHFYQHNKTDRGEACPTSTAASLSKSILTCCAQERRMW